jgi:microcystin-dependent protein
MALILDGTNGLSVTGDTDLITNGSIQEEDLGFTVQSPLVSGTNIKTLNSESLLGSGNITISVPAAFPAGTAMLFAQTSAPTGWTKSTTHNNKALRLVSGTAGSGGSAAFTTAFGTPSVSGSLSGTVGATTLSTAQMPSHRHGLYFPNGSGGTSVGTQNALNASTGNQTSEVIYAATAYEGSSNSHTHSFSGSLSSATASINVQYVDVIIATKDS